MGNHCLGLKVPSSVFSEFPAACRLMAKGAEMFNELGKLGFGAKIHIVRMRGSKRPVPHL